MGKSKGLTSYIWKFLERFSVQIASFLTTIILARIVSTDEYGIVSLLTVFVSLATVFVQGGFNTALIRKEETNNTDLSTVFFFSVFSATICYIIIFCLAPYIALFYKNEIIVPVARAVALSLFPGSLNSVQVAIATRNFEFKKIFIANILGAIIAAFFGIAMAILGFGVWAMVTWQLVNVTSTTIIMWFIIKWRPKMVFSWTSFRELIPFGSRILFSNFMVTLFQNIRTLLIGRFYTTSDLAYFNRGRQFPQVLMEGVIGSLQSVSLPVFAEQQNVLPTEYKKLLRNILTLSYLLIFPLLIGITIIAEPLIIILLTDKWISAVSYVQIFALIYLLQPTQIICAEALKAIGLSNVTLHIECWRKFFEIGLLIITISYGPKAVALSGLVAGFISIIIAMYPNNKYLKYSIKEQFSDIIGALTAAIIMGYISFLIGELISNIYIKLITQVIIGVLVYIIACFILKVRGLSIVQLKIKKLLYNKFN